MKKKLSSGVFIFFITGVLLFAAAPSDLFAKPGRGSKAVGIPAHAREVVPGKVFWLGIAVDEGRLVEGYAIIHHRKGFGKPSGCKDDGKCQGWEDPTCGDCQGGTEDPAEPSKCYGFIAKGAKWKTIEDYMVDASNGDGLDSSFIRGNLAADIAKWEDAADGMAGDGYIFDILGDEISGQVDGADLVSTDGKNEVLFGNISDPGAIGVTIVWGIFSGPPRSRELVEWDMVFDDHDFDWSEDCLSDDCTDKMDFENIATHELGHSLGLSDLYTNECLEETMYGYASEGETNKRTLEAGDITGIFKLYK